MTNLVMLSPVCAACPVDTEKNQKYFGKRIKICDILFIELFKQIRAKGS
jgi:hypothetical protein